LDRARRVEADLGEAANVSRDRLNCSGQARSGLNYETKTISSGALF
jgi:hypothetical protein